MNFLRLMWENQRSQWKVERRKMSGSGICFASLLRVEKILLKMKTDPVGQSFTHYFCPLGKKNTCIYIHIYTIYIYTHIYIYTIYIYSHFYC